MPYVSIEAIRRYQNNPNIQPKDLEGIPNYLGEPASARTARRWHLYLQEGLADPLPPDEPELGEGISMAEEDYVLQVTSNSETIKTLEQLLDSCNVDLDLWKVDRWEVKSYQGYRKDEHKDLQFYEGKMTGTIIDDGNVKLATMFSVKVWFVKREEKPFQDVLDKLIAKLESRPRPINIVKNYPQGEYLLLPGISDVHFARLSLDGKYTPEQTLQDLEDVGDAIIGRSLAMILPVNRILLPVGNDLLNVDNLSNTTTRGTWQESSAGIRDAVDAVCTGFVDMINKFVEVAPVDVKLVPGNHDRYSMYWLGKMLEAYFKSNKYVTVDNSQSPRKYYQYGANLIGMEHGDRIKGKELALIMAQEVPQMWGSTRHRVFFRGHFHKEYEMYVPIADAGGVHVVTFPAFCPPDSWELLMGYIGNNRAGVAHFFHTEQGRAGSFPVFMNEL